MSNQLIEAQRYEIYLGLQRKWSKSRIAREIEVSCSTVIREIRRNSKPDGTYVWKYANPSAKPASTALKAITASLRTYGGVLTA